jgi:hypothetical protein
MSRTTSIPRRTTNDSLPPGPGPDRDTSTLEQAGVDQVDEQDVFFTA